MIFLKFKHILLISLLSALIVIVGCGIQPGKSIAGQATGTYDECTSFCTEKYQTGEFSRSQVSDCMQQCADEETNPNNPIIEESGYGGNSAVCGNSKLEEGEECDDGNNINHDQCNNACLSAVCFDSDPLDEPDHLGAVVVVYGDQLGWKMQKDNCPSNTDKKVWEGSCTDGKDPKVTIQKLVPCPTGFACTKGICAPTGPNCGNLGDYPNMFVTYTGLTEQNNPDFQFNGYIVVGEKAPAIDNLAASDILTNMKMGTTPMTIIDATAAPKLDTEITNPFTQSLIIIGSPCVFTNEKIIALYGNKKANCNGELDKSQFPGAATIKLLKQPNEKYHLLISGYSGEERRLAAQILAYRSKELLWDEVKVESPTFKWQDATISSKVSPDSNCI